ncbi:MAG: aspartate ammonia-lyase [Treponema sp.]|jgi:aspartate ammonia-lyase|nr:aspartate ammonia-lyase [Treponema sp.]
MRIEKDSIGTLALDDDTVYGIQTARAIDNFSLHYKKTSPLLIRALVMVKKAAALTYAALEEKAAGTASGTAELYRAIAGACDRVLAMEHCEPLFPVDALQGGAGTSTNMNVNEVLANLALLSLGKPAGSYNIIHPIDHVNRGQSTNDVYPTALRIAAILALRSLSEQCATLQESLQRKENAWSAIKKLGRTELMDAVPITLGEEFGAYAQAVGRDRWRLYKIEERLRQVNLGGTAVGNADTAERRYRFMVYGILREMTGIGLAAAEYPMDITQNNDVFVEASGLLKALSVNLSKIAGDIRLMNAGPHGGIGEITVQPLQMGSTIMPGKVNPVIPEMVIQTAIRVQAHDFAITAAASRGEFELNAFLPLIADSLLESVCLLERAVLLFRTKCIETLTPNEERCAALLEASASYAASLVPDVGYEEAERIVKEREKR